MKAGIFFTGTGPILILTTFGELNDSTLVAKLAQKGIKKFIAYEVAESLVKEKYGQQFNIIMGDLKQSDDLRVLDYDGHHVFYNFALSELGAPVFHEGQLRVLQMTIFTYREHQNHWIFQNWKILGQKCFKNQIVLLAN